MTLVHWVAGLSALAFGCAVLAERRALLLLPLTLTGFLVPPLAVLPLLGPPLERFWTHRRLLLERDLCRRQFGDLLLLLALSALDGYGVFTALAQIPETLPPPPLSRHLACLRHAIIHGGDVVAALEEFRTALPLPAVDRLVDTIRRERLFGLGVGDTMLRQLDLFRLEERGRRQRLAGVLPYLFTISVGFLFLDAGLVVFLPFLTSLVRSLGVM